MCRRKTSDQSSTHTFPQDRAWRKTFWLCAMKAFCLLRPWERDGLIREHDPGLWEKALKVGWTFFSFISAVLWRRCRRCPSWRMRAVLTTGGRHSIGGFIFLSPCDSSQPSCNRCSSVLLLLGWTPDQKQLNKERVIRLALQVTIHPWGKPEQELKTGTWEPWKKVACWIVLCWRSYTALGSPS